MLCAFFVLMGGSLHFGEAAAVQPTDGPTRPPSMSAEDEGARAMQEAFAKGGDWVSTEQLSPVLDALTE